MIRTKMASLWMVLFALTSFNASAQDWPQWRGPNRDGKAPDFKVPATWPKELTQKWKVTVGDGAASPVLVGDKVFVFSRQDGNEVARCLSITDGKEVWSDKYESLGASGPAQGFSGPRSTPAVADGKIVTIGVRGMISCLDAASGKKLWRKDDFKAWPTFFPSSSPLIRNGVAIAQLGGKENGAIIAYDLATGTEKWRWNGPAPAYASPVLMGVDGATFVVAQTESKLVAVNADDGKLAWELGSTPPPAAADNPGGAGGGPGRGRGGRPDNRAPTPAIAGQNIYVAGRGVRALKLTKDGAGLKSQELWNQADKYIAFSSPTLRGEMLFGLTGNNELFCLNTKDGSFAWTAPFPGSTNQDSGPRATLERLLQTPAPLAFGQATPPEGDRPGRPDRPGGGPGGPGGPGGQRMRGGGGGGGGYGSIVDAGKVLMALTPAGQLVVFSPSDKEFKQLASYKVGSQTHASPVLSGNRILIKDRDSLALWTAD